VSTPRARLRVGAASPARGHSLDGYPQSTTERGRCPTTTPASHHHPQEEDAQPQTHSAKLRTKTAIKKKGKRGHANTSLDSHAAGKYELSDDERELVERTVASIAPFTKEEREFLALMLRPPS
jgi:hypothetical protein